MRVCGTIAEVRAVLAGEPEVGFVPTMGALHAGHVALVQKCREECKKTAVSIFVNPTQFAPGEDLDKYPRRTESDLELCESNGADVVFLPTVDEMYRGSLTTVHVTGPSELWEGAERPGHFDGVATVVLKLFHIVQPVRAYFGLKDLQQCAVLRQMVKDLDLAIGLRFVETVRDEFGLALSSRNDYLSSSVRLEASNLHRCLQACREALLRQPNNVKSIIQEGRSTLVHQGFGVSYLALVDPVSMQEEAPARTGLRLIVAARFHGVRLIDNIAL
ncbi:MAG: pantoate--beta-alanine ligase [Armatimonadetes bacterium]|nr:pantoate--beta-alanine ligase [Armatimonadota bacterium]